MYLTILVAEPMYLRHFVYLTIFTFESNNLKLYLSDYLCLFHVENLLFSVIFLSDYLWNCVYSTISAVLSIYLMSLSLVCYDDGCIIFFTFVDASLRHILLPCARVTASYFAPVGTRHCVIFFSCVHASLRHIFLPCSCVTALYFSPVLMRHCVNTAKGYHILPLLYFYFLSHPFVLSP